MRGFISALLLAPALATALVVPAVDIEQEWEEESPELNALEGYEGRFQYLCVLERQMAN